MNYARYEDWILLQIDQTYDLKTVGEFLDDFQIRKDRKAWLDGKILLNRFPVEEGTYLKKGDTLQIRGFEPEEVDYLPDENLPEVVYEDDFVLVVNKPRGIIIYPENKTGTGTLANRVAAYYISRGEKIAVRPIHRLDRDTLGLVVFSKCPFLQPKLDQMMYRHQIHRYYYAFVEGRITEDGTVDAPIGRDRHNAGRMRVANNGQKAVTHYRVVRPMKNFTLLECTLETGRTHQIRVHMSFIKHPIVNDPLYGEPFDNLEMGLQAYKIIFTNPLTGKNTRAEVGCAFERKDRVKA